MDALLKSWLFWAVLSAVFAALLIVVSSISLKNAPAHTVAFYRGVGIVIISMLIAATLPGNANMIGLVGSRSELPMLLLVGALSGLAIYTFYMAFTTAQSADTVPDSLITSVNYASLLLIPVINVALLGRESFRLEQAIGIVVIFIGFLVFLAPSRQ
ncbi:MAG: EamA family transporter [Pseudomonadota bacterium]